MKKSDLKTIIREEIQKALTEATPGYTSDIPTAWTTSKVMVDDLTQLLQDTYDANGPEGVEEVISSMQYVISQAQQYLK
jgi:hypothetical protein